MNRLICIASLFFGCMTSVGAQQASAESITLPWTERKPYQYVGADGKLKGILYDLGESIFGKAQLSKEWAEIPANRIASMLESGDERVCLVGWFKTPEREKIAKVSLPIYQDKPLHGVVRADSAIKDSSALKEVTANKDVRILIKQGYSYGRLLDELIAKRDPKSVENAVGDHSKLLLMLWAKRADIMFMPKEEIDYYLASDAAFKSNSKVITFKDIPMGNQRHILCSKQVSDAAMEKLNVAIKSVIKLAP